jgi:hypothetical protein
MSSATAAGTMPKVRLETNPSGGDLWSAVDALIDRAATEDDIRAHRLEVLAARRYRVLGRPVPGTSSHKSGSPVLQP